MNASLWNIDQVRAEWPQSALNVDADLRSWREGSALYERDDYASILKAADLMGRAVAHSLYGNDILDGSELPDTTFKVMWASLNPPPDRQTFADNAQRCARLALTVMREKTYQPVKYGGTNDSFLGFMEDTGNYMLLCTAVSPPNQPWAGDLRAFFAQPLTAMTPPPSQAPAPRTGVDPDAEALIDEMHASMVAAESGDVVEGHLFKGFSLATAGKVDEALTELGQAANLGSVRAMVLAGEVCQQHGRRADAIFWFNTAALAGHGASMNNLAVYAVESGDRDIARQWWERAAQAGHVDAFAALTQLASDRQDRAGEDHWARLGAEAGHPFCMGRHALMLAMGDDQSMPTKRRARDFGEAAGDQGDLDGAMMAAELNRQLGEPARSRRYAEIILASGDAEKIDRLRRYGLL